MRKTLTRTQYPRQATSVLLVLSSLALLGSSIYYAALAPFNFDESVSFAIFNWSPGARDGANHHPLNTLLMQGASMLLGNSELALRLPNVLAHALYLACTLALVRRLSNLGLQITGFILLNIHPLILYYFTVARGYGLALAFQAASLYFLFRTYEGLLGDPLPNHPTPPPGGSAATVSRYLVRTLALILAFTLGTVLAMQVLSLSFRIERSKVVLAAWLIGLAAVGSLARQRASERYLYLTLGAASLAVVANLTFLNYFVPVLGLCAWILIIEESDRLVHGCVVRHFAARVAIFCASGAFAAAVVTKVDALNRAGELYIGGSNGFMHDTVQGLLEYSLVAGMYSPATGRAIATLVVGSFLALMLLGVRQLRSTVHDRVFMALAWILTAAVALPIVQHHVLNVPFPHPRAALYYLPLYCLAIVYGCDRIVLRAGGQNWRPIAAWSLAVVAITAAGYSSFAGGLRTAYSWGEDNHDREVLELIDRDRAQHFPGRTVTLQCYRIFEPSLNFYRVTRTYDWLAPVLRDPRPYRGGPDPRITGEHVDYVYLYERDLAQLRVEHARLASFPDIQTVLLRVVRPARP